jgi:dTDP-4-dehydrorhamnose reductase
MLTLLASTKEDAYGTYHYAGGKPLSWHGFAQAIFDCAARHGYRAPRVLPIGSDDYPTAAARPKNSRLDGSKLLTRFAINQHDFDGPLERCVTELLQEQS